MTDKPGYCPILNMSKTEPSIRCLRSECEWWHADVKKCAVSTSIDVLADVAVLLDREE